VIERFKQAIEEIVRNVFPNIKFLGTYRYRFVTKNSDRVELQAVSKGVPDALPISVWPGIPGCDSTPADGAEVLLIFIDGDPSLPVVTHFCGKDSANWEPISITIAASTEIKLGKSALKGVARLGDSVGPFAITSASTKVMAE